jgi:hypothetical protein
MYRIRQSFSVAAYNCRQWNKNPRIFITFALAFILCFLLSDKAVRFAKEYETTMQIVEAFVWTFGDSNSILLASLLLLLLFADMPFINSGTPFYHMRIDRKTCLGTDELHRTRLHDLYSVHPTATSLICMRQSSSEHVEESCGDPGHSGAGRPRPSIARQNTRN